MVTKTPNENPYLAARMEWNERYGSYIRSARIWQSLCLLSMGMAVIGFGFALYQSTQVKLVPYIVEVDKLGTPAIGGFPAKIEYADERVIRSMLGAWITNLRSITPDMIVAKGYIDQVYAMLRQTDIATQKINNFYRTNPPFDRAQSRTVTVEVTNIVPISSQSYQVDWTEIERDRKGKELGTKRWRGIAAVTLSPPQDEAVIRLNPIGLYVKDFEWTAQL